MVGRPQARLKMMPIGPEDDALMRPRQRMIALEGSLAAWAVLHVGGKQLHGEQLRVEFKA